MRSIDFAMNTISSAREIVRGSSIMKLISWRMIERERGVDRVVAVDDLGGGVDVEPRERVERLVQHRLRMAGDVPDVEVPHVRQPVAAVDLAAL